MKKRLCAIILIVTALSLAGEVLWSRLSYRSQDDPFSKLLAEHECTPYSVVAEPFIDAYEFVFGAAHDLSDVARKFCGKNPIEVALNDLKKGRAQSFYLTHDMSGVRFAYGGLGQMSGFGNNSKMSILADAVLAEGCVIGGQSGDTAYSNLPLKQRMGYYNYTIALFQEAKGVAGRSCRPRIQEKAENYDAVRLSMVLGKIKSIQGKFSAGEKEQGNLAAPSIIEKLCTPDLARAEEGLVYDDSFKLEYELINSRFCGQDPVDLALKDLEDERAATYISMSSFGNDPDGWLQSNNKEIAEHCAIAGLNYYSAGRYSEGRFQDMMRYNYAIALSPQVRAHSKIDCRPEGPEYAAIYDEVEQKIISKYPNGKAGYKSAIEAARNQPKPARAVSNLPIFK